MNLADHLRKACVDEGTIEQIMAVPYAKSDDPKQDAANFYAAAMKRCGELLSFDTIAEVMYDRACCKSGGRLTRDRAFAKEHGDKPLDEKLALLGQVQWMGRPRLNVDGDLETVAVGASCVDGMVCPCWQLGGHTPQNGPMPLSYCLCCAGHFRFHYQKALGVKLKVTRVVSSILNSGGNEPCVFVYEIIEK